MTKWAVVATVKASTDAILGFAAHHLDLGAHRVYIYLDAPNPDARAALKQHPKCRVTFCSPAHWQALSGARPAKHQARQTLNANHAYGRAADDVDWLAHVDVDEFLIPDRPVQDVLSGLEDQCLTARSRPMEQLAGTGSSFKAFIPGGRQRQQIVAEIYPTFGPYIKGGFLSHVAGKYFVRTGLQDIKLRIHNVYQGQAMNPGSIELHEIPLAHCHAPSWDDWQQRYRYRLDHGSYRPELGATSGLNLNALFKTIEATEGDTGLRAFFEEVCADTPDMRARLQARGLLRHVQLELAEKIARHFPPQNL